MEIVIWLGLCAAIAYYANKKSRSAILWGLIAFFFSPLLAGLVLALLKDKSVQADISEIRLGQQQLHDRIASDEKMTEEQFRRMEMAIQTQQKSHQSIAHTNVPVLNDSEYKLCPYCKERIKKDAIKCRFCHQMLTGTENPVSVVNKKHYCTECGSILEENATFCAHCGARIK